MYIQSVALPQILHGKCRMIVFPSSMTSWPHYQPTNLPNNNNNRKWMQSCLPARPPFGCQLTPMCPYMVTVFWSDVVWQAASLSTLQLEWLSDLSGFCVSSVSRLAVNLSTHWEIKYKSWIDGHGRFHSQKWMKISICMRWSLHVKIQQCNADIDHNL